LSEGLGTKNPGSFQTGGDCDRPLTAAQAASFNPRITFAIFGVVSTTHLLPLRSLVRHVGLFAINSKRIVDSARESQNHFCYFRRRSYPNDVNPSGEYWGR
jgi:hypothetical protein